MSTPQHLDTSHPEDELPEFKARCCMKYTVEDKQCKRCPFHQITDHSEMNEAMNKCREKRRGEHKKDTLKIEYNNQYI
jgi:hypothetical protein